MPPAVCSVRHRDPGAEPSSVGCGESNLPLPPAARHNERVRNSTRLVED